MTPEQEAAYALDWDLSRDGLDPAVQIEYDRLKMAREARRDAQPQQSLSAVVVQRQYRLPTRLAAFFGVGGAVVLVLSAAVVPAAASQLQQGGMSGVVVGSVLTLAGAFFIALAVRTGPLTVDDGGLHLRTLTRTRVIPWALVRSFGVRAGSHGWWIVWVELGTGKKLRLQGSQGSRDRAERIAAELTAAHREHLA